MITKNISKLVIMAVLAISMISSSGVVAEQIGLNVTPTVHACGGGTNGGGC